MPLPLCRHGPTANGGTGDGSTSNTFGWSARFYGAAHNKHKKEGAACRSLFVGMGRQPMAGLEMVRHPTPLGGQPDSMARHITNIKLRERLAAPFFYCRDLPPDGPTNPHPNKKRSSRGDSRIARRRIISIPVVGGGDPTPHNGRCSF